MTQIVNHGVKNPTRVWGQKLCFGPIIELSSKAAASHLDTWPKPPGPEDIPGLVWKEHTEFRGWKAVGESAEDSSCPVGQVPQVTVPLLPSFGSCCFSLWDVVLVSRPADKQKTLSPRAKNEPMTQAGVAAITWIYGDGRWTHFGAWHQHWTNLHPCLGLKYISHYSLSFGFAVCLGRTWQGCGLFLPRVEGSRLS